MNPAPGLKIREAGGLTPPVSPAPHVEQCCTETTGKYLEEKENERLTFFNTIRLNITSFLLFTGELKPPGH